MERNARRLGFLAGWLSAAVNVVLFALKIGVGMRAGSVAMMAEAWHTLSDSLSSAVVLVGFWYTGKRGDPQHPFGHGRAEVIAAVVVSSLLGVVGLNFLRESIGSLLDPRAVRFTAFSIAVFAMSVVIKEGLAQFAIRAGKRTGSRSLIADGWHHRSDAIASALIVAGALLGGRLWWIDGALGIGVSLLILHAAFEILRDAGNALMGEAPGEEMRHRVEELVRESVPGVSDVHHVHIHRYGDHIEMTLHLRLPQDLPLRDAHTCASMVEGVLRERLGIEPTVHLEPDNSAAGES
ncbi:MAG: cation diffusion facilitator family transporter [Chitinivibrionales bacterium]|nr:cation diffusion facilitator family transporter [Chitinivibrionales bacterium]